TWSPMTPPMAAPPTVPSTPPLDSTAPPTAPTPAPVAALFWRLLMPSHVEQPAMVKASTPTAPSFVKDDNFIFNLQTLQAMLYVTPVFAEPAPLKELRG